MQPAAPGSPKAPENAPSRRGSLSRFFFASVGSRRVQPRWGRFFAAAAALSAILYFAVTSAWFAALRYHRQVPGVRLADTLLPNRWIRVQEALGLHALATGISSVRRGEIVEAVAYLNSGLRRVPNHQLGRRVLADLQVAFKNITRAKALLLEGLPFHHTDPKYLHVVFRFLLDHHDDQEAVNLARRLLPSLSPDSEAARICALAAAMAGFHRGNFDLAEDFVRAARLQTPEAQVLLAKLEWERGYRDLALVQLRGLAESQPSDPLVHYELLARLRELGLKDEVRRRSVAYQIADPSAVLPRLNLLRAYHETGDDSALAREANAIVRDFPQEHGALLGLGEVYATIGHAGLADELLAHARAQSMDTRPFAFLHLEALLARRDYAAGLEAMTSLRADSALTREHAALLRSLEAVAALGIGDSASARIAVKDLLDFPGLRADNLLALANRFADLDAPDDACRILARAVEVDPANQAALSRLIELELNFDRLEELPAHLLRLVQMRRPSPDILRVAHHKLGSDLLLFSTERAAALEAVRHALVKADRPLISRTN